MKRLWLLLAVPLVFFSAVGAEATLCPSGGSTTFQNYLGAGFACEIGDKTFSGFTYGSVHVDADEVAVTTLNDGTNFGFRFVMSLGTIGDSADIALGYNVAVTDGSARITDVTVTQVSSVGGAAFATVGETVCIGGTYPACKDANGDPLPERTLETTDSNPSAHTEFDPVSVVGLLKDFNVLALACPVGQECPNFATLTLVDNTVSHTVPEPATLLLLGFGLVGVATWSRKKFRK